MRYMGSKAKLLQWISSCLDECGIEPTSFADLFCGTACVAQYFAAKPGVDFVMANDCQYYAHIMSKARLCNETTDLSKYQECNPIQGFIHQNYGIDRTYFSRENAAKIDGIRDLIRQESDGDFIALASLLEAVGPVSNTTGVFQTYLKTLQPCAKPALKLKPVHHGVNSDANIECRCEDVLQMCHDYGPVDLCYLDPPYNGRKYSTYYHLLETIAKGDRPVIQGVGGQRTDDIVSPTINFYHKKTVKQAFHNLLFALPTTWVAISYSSEGILTEAQLEEILCQAGYTDVRVFKRQHVRYSSKSLQSPTVQELLFVARKSRSEA